MRGGGNVVRAAGAQVSEVEETCNLHVSELLLLPVSPLIANSAFYWKGGAVNPVMVVERRGSIRNRLEAAKVLGAKVVMMMSRRDDEGTEICTSRATFCERRGTEICTERFLCPCGGVSRPTAQAMTN